MDMCVFFVELETLFCDCQNRSSFWLVCGLIKLLFLPLLLSTFFAPWPSQPCCSPLIVSGQLCLPRRSRGRVAGGRVAEGEHAISAILQKNKKFHLAAVPPR